MDTWKRGHHEPVVVHLRHMQYWPPDTLSSPFCNQPHTPPHPSHPPTCSWEVMDPASLTPTICTMDWIRPSPHSACSKQGGAGVPWGAWVSRQGSA